MQAFRKRRPCEHYPRHKNKKEMEMYCYFHRDKVGEELECRFKKGKRRRNKTFR
jgi:hypothetical protein